ncbi:MAG: tyrosine--tRNA ligase [Bacteroidota bacterium]
MSFIEELRWRGLIHDLIPGTEEYLNEHKVSGYLGVDPTGNSMHIGNMVPVMMMVHLQRHGHHPVLLVGGATARVGDPSGKDAERPLMSSEQVDANAAAIRDQLARFMDFDTPENPARMVNNYDWFQSIGFLEFLRDVGKHITISYMMGKESVKKRIASDSGLSYTEFAYQLLQGYDFLHLYENEGVKLQVGGSDQWGNITTGTELIRRKLSHEEKAFAVVCPLLTGATGAKLGKTAGGKNVWLDPERTTPYEFYQYWVSLSDEDMIKCAKIFSLKDRETLEGMIAAHAEDPGHRQLHYQLAEELTERLHGPEGLENAKLMTDFFFGRIKSKEALQKLNAKQWAEVAKASDLKTLSKADIAEGIGVLTLLTQIGATSSNGEARRAIEKDKSVKVNMEGVSDSNATIQSSDLFFDRYLFLQKGKKNKFIIEISE